MHFISCKLFTIQYVFYTYSTFQFVLAIFQALDIMVCGKGLPYWTAKSSHPPHFALVSCFTTDLLTINSVFYITQCEKVDVLSNLTKSCEKVRCPQKFNKKYVLEKISFKWIWKQQSSYYRNWASLSKFTLTGKLFWKWMGHAVDNNVKITIVNNVPHNWYIWQAYKTWCTSCCCMKFFFLMKITFKDRGLYHWLLG